MKKKLSKEFYFIIGILIGVIMMIAVSSVAQAEERNFFDEHEVLVGYAPWCKHISSKPKYNEDNNHLFMLSIDQWFIMTFRNSYYDRTYAVGYTFRTTKWKPFNNEFYFRGNLSLGLMYGYGDHRNIKVFGISPGGVLTVETGYKNFSIHTAVLPVASLMLTYTF